MDISIIIPCNKDRGYLKAAIFSAKEQNFKGSYEIILSAQRDKSLLNYTRIFKIIPNYNNGINLSMNLNDAIKKAKGKYVKFLHEDDILTRSCLADLFENIGSYSMICANANEFGGKNINMVKSQIVDFQTMLKENHIHGGTTMFLRSALFDVGLYDETIFSSEDWDIYLKLLGKGHKYTYIDKVVYWYRRHIYQKSVPAKSEKRMLTRQVIRKKYENMYNQS